MEANFRSKPIKRFHFDRKTLSFDLKISLSIVLPIYLSPCHSFRRFGDVMEEESERVRESRLEAWGRDDFSVYKPARVLGEQTVETTQGRTEERTRDATTNQHFLTTLAIVEEMTEALESSFHCCLWHYSIDLRSF